MQGNLIKSLCKYKSFMKYFKNTSWIFFEKILRMVVGLFVGVWVARYLGPERFGLFSYAQSFVGLFSAVATLGLDGIVVRDLVKDESRRDELIGTAFWLKVINAIAVLIILSIAVNFTSNDQLTNILVFIIASATIFQSFNVIDFYFQSKVLSRYVVYANIISLFMSSVVKIILILNEAPLIAFAWVVVFDSIVLACGFVYYYIKYSTFSIKNLISKKEIAVSLLKDSWPLILSGIAIMIYVKIDQVMIKEMLDSEAVGQYAAAAKISEIFLIPIGILSNSLAPAIFNRIGKISEFQLYKILSQGYTIFGYLILFVVILISDMFINISFGKMYSETSDILKILIIFIFSSRQLERSFSKYF